MNKKELEKKVEELTKRVDELEKKGTQQMPAMPFPYVPYGIPVPYYFAQPCQYCGKTSGCPGHLIC